MEDEELLFSIQKLFQEAEDDIKGVEQSSLDLCTPAVNELRYAGHHVLKGLVASAPEECEEQYRRASRHCLRARYDAVEIRLWSLLDEFRAFQKDYQAVSIPQVWPDYVDCAEKFDVTMALLNSVKKTEPSDIDDQGDNRVDLLERTREASRQLEPIVSKAKIARIELNKILDDQKRQIRMGIWAIVVTFIGIIVTIIVT
ncbi:MAG: hypothetical protein H7829_15860 [Magnetococcus sp. THC-1_WYH]